MDIKTVGDLKQFLRTYEKELPDDALIGCAPIIGNEFACITSIKVSRVTRTEPTKDITWPRYWVKRDSRIPVLMFDI